MHTKKKTNASPDVVRRSELLHVVAVVLDQAGTFSGGGAVRSGRRALLAWLFGVSRNCGTGTSCCGDTYYGEGNESGHLVCTDGFKAIAAKYD